MQYTIERESRTQKVLRKFRSISEDCFLSGVLFLAKITKSEKLSAWVTSYTMKKIQSMQQQIIRMKWDKVTLEKATAAINEKQSNN